LSTGSGRGGFITLEGGEGAGKSTQVKALVERLAERGLPAIATREPGGSHRAEAIRTVLLSGVAAGLGATAEAILFAAARLDHLQCTIRPALARGQFVVCDRFADSTRAYQGTVGAVPSGLIGALEDLVVGATRPDLTLLLDLDPVVGLARAKSRRGAGQALADQNPQRCRLIDADAPSGAVGEAIWAEVAARFELGPVTAERQGDRG
jgi:dTMP kinase